MDEVIQLNQINVLVEPERQRLAEFLLQVRKHAPVLHISFSADPSPLFTQKLVTWLRREIHPFVLLQIGLQPNIGAGCVVRTTNQYFDFSLRQNFIEKRGLLAEKLIVGAAQ
jgi:F0F1-type ATP synthase delta subunit